MSSLRESIEAAIADMPIPVEIPPDPQQSDDDEIIAAIIRQLDVVEGTLVMLSNVHTMLHLQLRNLRAEVELFGVPPADAVPEPVVAVRRTPSGATVASTAPPKPGMPVFCGHDDAILVDTIDGPQKVCPECDPDE